jgi:hypothetical protein
VGALSFAAERPYRSLIAVQRRTIDTRGASLSALLQLNSGPTRLNTEAASMANLPDTWVEDARNLDNAEQLLHSAHGILLETPAIGDFLRNETNKRIVVAPKGYGKTFLLKSKRILLQRNSEICRACRTINW